MKRHVSSTQYFYQDDKLITVKQDAQSRGIVRALDMLLAEQRAHTQHTSRLLATDGKGSVLQARAEEDDEPHVYSPYGHDPEAFPDQVLVGFNGEHRDVTLEGYLLGNGYRLYSPALMRFCAPDILSPFERGGINAYVYCAGDPVNHVDPSGHVRVPKIRLEHFKTVKRLPQSTITKTGNGKYTSTTWQPKDVHIHESVDLYVLESQRAGEPQSYVPKPHRKTYKSIKSELDTVNRSLILRPSLKNHEAVQAHIESLIYDRNQILDKGREMYNSAMDPNNLSWYIRNADRVTPGSSLGNPSIK